MNNNETPPPFHEGTTLILTILIMVGGTILINGIIGRIIYWNEMEYNL